MSPPLARSPRLSPLLSPLLSPRLPSRLCPLPWPHLPSQSHAALDYYQQRYSPVYDGVTDPNYFVKDAPIFSPTRQLIQPPTTIGKGNGSIAVDRLTAAVGPLIYGKPLSHGRFKERHAPSATVPKSAVPSFIPGPHP